MSFKSWRSYWEFSKKVMHDHRYIRDREAEDFLSEVLYTSKSRQRDLRKGHILWRSQLEGGLRPIIHDGEVIDEETCPHFPERMLPLKYMATEGRVNPKGIPCLYLADDKETAMGEARPWVGSDISVAQFKLLKDIQLIDCSVNHSSSDPLYLNVDTCYFYEPDEQEREKAVWTYIDKAFSEPVMPNENQAHYAPTQIIAELFKSNGLDGVVYKSRLGEGYNVALFDVSCAELINCFLYRAKSVAFKFEMEANPYFVSKKP